MKIGILALQGAFVEHRKMLQKLSVESFEIRQPNDIQIPLDGLILPGGESTVVGKLLCDLELISPLRSKITEGMPTWGTCAGLILLAKTILDDNVVHFATMDITAKRNAYGRQLGSFHTKEEFKGIGMVPMTFIRAPYIEKVEGDTQILAEVDGRIVAARQKNQFVTAFHPELTDNMSVHQYFLKMIQ